MASRINVKFVIFLTIGITLVSGMLVGAAYVVLTKSGEEYIARAQAAEAEGDYVRAAEMYGRAVGHDRTNVEWLHMWFDALVKSTPETRPEYEKSYIEHYLGILNSLATLQDRDPDVQRRYLEAVKEHNWWLNPSTEAWEDLADLTSRALDRLDQEDPKAQALRRYRGLAILNQMQLFQPADTVQGQALDDLRAAVAADPDDVECAIAIARWHLIRWQNAQNARRELEAADFMQGLEEQRVRLEERFGQNPEARLFLLEMEIARALATSTTYAQERIAVRGLAQLGAEQPLLDVMANLESPSLSSNVYERMLRVLLVLRPEDGAEIALGIIGRGLENAPNDPELLLLNGSTLGTYVDPEEAIIVLQRLVDLPDMPVGLQGMLLRDFRVQAVAMQCENALRQWERTDPGAEKDDWMQRAKAYRAQVVEKSRRGEDDRAVMMLDARIALAEVRFQAALAALQRYRTSTAQDNTEVLRLMTRALIGLNQLGAAKSTIEQLLELEPDNVQALLLGAEVDRQLLDRQSARLKLQMAVNIEPDNEELRAALLNYDRSLGIVEADDPVVTLLIEIQNILVSADADVSVVRTKLRQGIADFPDDLRPILALLELEASMNNTDEALALADRALELEPDNQYANRYRRRLTAEDPVEFALGEIELADMPEIEKLLRQRAVLLNADRTDEAAAALEQAKAIDDRHPLVIEAEFIVAIDSDDLATAQQLQAKAAETNADEVNGALYQVVLDQKRGDHRTAVDSLDAIVEQLPYSGRAWMLLGQSQMQLGRVEQAIESMRTAFEASPDDVRSAQTLITALMQVQREDEALLIARRSAELNPAALQSQRLRMQLEELTGDLQFAIARRERLFEAAPNDMENVLALIRIYVNESRWTDADRLIAHARDISGDSLALALIEGRAIARQTGVDSGQQIIQEFISSLEPSEINTDPYLALAEFYLEFEREDEALAAMQAATAYQRPDILEADRRIGDFLFDRARYEDAIDPYTRLAAIESDDHAVILKRLAETYSRLERWDEAEQTIDRMDNGGADDLEAALLRAEIATGRGNAEETEHYLDEAVRLGPGNPLPFIRRAQAHFADPAFHEDALKDLDQALVLRPTSIRARMMRAALLAENGRHAESVSELRKGIEYSPENDELRTTLVAELIRLNAWSDATATAETAIADRPGDAFWLRFAGDVFMGASGNVASDREVSRYLERASDLYAEAQELDYDEDYASRLLTALMLQKPPQADRALRVLNGLAPETQQFSEFLIMRSIIYSELGQPDQALEAANNAFASATTGGELRVWFAQVPQIFASPRVAATYMENLTPPVGLETLFDVQLCTVLAGDVGIRSELVDRLHRAEESAPDDDTLVDIFRLRSELEYALGDYEAAAASLQAGRSLRPDDLEFNNNLAYVLARQLGRLDEAIVPAEKAAELSPNSSTVLDTLGWVYYRTDQIAKAEESLRRAVDLAETAVEAVPANFHMAELMFLREEYRSARRFLERAQQNLRQAPSLQEEFGPELETLMERLDQAE